MSTMQMRKYTVILLVFAFLMPTVCHGQRRKSAKKPKKEVVVEPVENPLITQMLEAVQKVVFIDSMVVNEASFYNYLPLSPECGQLLQKGGSGQYTNELSDRRIEGLFHKGDSTTYLATSDFIGGEWTAPAPVKGIGSGNANYPYIMPDGTTLYYAQKGEKSIGGYDIFVTRYNIENGSYLKPENIGMPFASEDNDYLYVVDEPMQLGYFVTDRRQPKGKVCIYVFIPSASRKVYPSEAYSNEKLRSLAAIHCIADTWGDGKERKNALERLKQARETFAARQSDAKTGRQTMTNLDKMRQQAQNRQKALDDARKDYATATAETKAQMKDKILKDEKELEELLLKIRQTEKEERNRNTLKNQ